jgi:hypothetical protein
MRPLKLIIDQYLEICESFLSRYTGFWELILQPLEKCGHFRNIDINLWDLSILTVPSYDSCWQYKFERERFHNNKLLSCCDVFF